MIIAVAGVCGIWMGAAPAAAVVASVVPDADILGCAFVVIVTLFIGVGGHGQ